MLMCLYCRMRRCNTQNNPTRSSSPLQGPLQDALKLSAAYDGLLSVITRQELLKLHDLPLLPISLPKSTWRILVEIV